MGILRHAKALSGLIKRPLVGILANCVDRYGRDILQGATRFANLQRKWLLYRDMDMVLASKSQWPELDAMIVAGIPLNLLNRALQQCEGRVVVCSGSGDPEISPVVAVDNLAVGRAAAKHLLECRLRHFGYFGDKSGHIATQARLQGCREVLQEAGYGCSICPTPLSEKEQRVSHQYRPEIIRWLRELPHPVGILAFDDTQAHDLAEACLEADLDVPNQIAIIGVNNDRLLCESSWPPLSSVDADYSRLGYVAAGLVETMLAGTMPPIEDRRILIQPNGVVQRQSTNTLAIDDADVAAAVRFIREHACDPCSVDDVVNAVQVGRRWLERQFSLRLGRSPHEEILRVRIETASRLLRQSDFKILDIAGRCGFRDFRSFYRAFAQATGTTPAAARQAAKGNVVKV